LDESEKNLCDEYTIEENIGLTFIQNQFYNVCGALLRHIHLRAGKCSKGEKPHKLLLRLTKQQSIIANQQNSVFLLGPKGVGTILFLFSHFCILFSFILFARFIFVSLFSIHLFLLQMSSF